MNTRYISKLNSVAAGFTFVAAAVGLLIITAPTSQAADQLLNGAVSAAPTATISKGASVAPFNRSPLQDVRDEYTFTTSGGSVKTPSAARVASERDPRCDVRDECSSNNAYREPVGNAAVRVTGTDEGETKVR